MKPGIKIFGIVFVVFVLLVIILMYYDTVHPVECVKSEKVTKILALEYRSGVIQLESGKNVTVNQATLKPGDNYCTEWKRK